MIFDSPLFEPADINSLTQSFSTDFYIIIIFKSMYLLKVQPFIANYVPEMKLPVVECSFLQPVLDNHSF